MTVKKYSIGASTVNEIVIDDPKRSVSRQHAVLITEDDANFDLCDISAAHGVFVYTSEGPSRIQRAKVGLGDRISIGDYETTVGDLLSRAGIHPHVFISYSRQDRDRSRIIAQFLSDRSLRVWWDDQLQVARPFDEQLEQQIKQARSVIVLWSEHSIKSQWVRAEAGLALDRNVLIPVFIDNVEAPLLFRQIQGHFATAWNDSAALRDQLTELGRHVAGFLRLEQQVPVAPFGWSAAPLQDDLFGFASDK